MRRLGITTVGFAVTIAVVLLWTQWETALAKPPFPVPRGPEAKGTPVGKQNQSVGEQNQGHTKGSKSKRHGAFGVVSALDLSEGSVTGSFVLTTKKGDEITVIVSEDTVCNVPGAGNPGKPSNSQCGDIVDGDYAAVQGTPNETEGLDARRVNMVPGRSLHFHCVGEVTVVDDDELTVDCRKGDETVFTVTESTKFHPENIGELTDISEGDLVTVVATRDRSMEPPTLVAKGVVLHKAKD